MLLDGCVGVGGRAGSLSSSEELVGGSTSVVHNPLMMPLSVLLRRQQTRDRAVPSLTNLCC